MPDVIVVPKANPPLIRQGLEQDLCVSIVDINLLFDINFFMRLSHFYQVGLRLGQDVDQHVLRSQGVGHRVALLRDFCRAQEQQNSSLLMFCFPDGFQVRDQDLKVINDPNPECSIKQGELSDLQLTGICKHDMLYSFITTDQQGRRQYCSALGFHEKYYVQAQRPKSFYKKVKLDVILNNLSPDPNIELLFLPKVLLMITDQDCLAWQLQVLKLIYKEMILPEYNLSQKEVKADLDYERFVAFREKREVISDRGRRMEMRVSKMLEFVIGWATSVPKQSLVTYTIPGTPFAFPPDHPLHPSHCLILSLLPPIQLSHLLIHLLLQNKILLLSSSPHLTTLFLTMLHRLLTPLQYAATFVPFLPMHMWRMVEAIGGYVIGIERGQLDFIRRGCYMKDIILVDLDLGVVVEEDCCGGKGMEEMERYLVEQLSPLVPLKPSVELTARLRIIFLRMLLSLLGHTRYYSSNKVEDWIAQFPESRKAFAKEISSTLWFDLLMQNRQSNILLELQDCYEDGEFYQLLQGSCSGVQSCLARHKAQLFQQWSSSIRQRSLQKQLFAFIIQKQIQNSQAKAHPKSRPLHKLLNLHSRRLPPTVHKQRPIVYDSKQHFID